ncbi:MAG: 1-acyl-sn-glycerol-3-phosphate acyltransferase [Ruminococcaceae bacterium]|nr:1-acyl-sn-glycerol-3-phosphate acyltransferase [Oscillospiraceae bacterium]
MEKTTKKQQWLKPRHKIITNLARAILAPYTRWKYGVDVVPFKESKNRQYLIIMNHQTAFDQFFIGMTFKQPVYYIATEDIFSLGWLSSLLKWAVAPIPIKKQTTDMHAVMTCMRVAKEGGTIALAPEGNRTYDGRTVYINPAIAKLAKKLRLPIAVFRIEGGYGVEPRWSDVQRKGKMKAYVAKVIEPEEYKAMSDDEFYNTICRELYVDEAVADAEFYHKQSAEYMERLVYVCPYCGLAEFESHNDIVECKKCHRQIRYLPTKELQGVNFDFPFKFIANWYDYQKEFINSLDLNIYNDKPMYEDSVKLSEVIVYKNKNVLREDCKISLYGDKIVFDQDTDIQLVLPFSEITALSVLGKNKANIYHDNRVYQLKGNKRFNAIKYVNIYYRFKNISKGEENGKFLGL